MPFRKWFGGKIRPVGTGRKSRLAQRLACERLEDRCLLSYTITDVGTPFSGPNSNATGINNVGQVVGYGQPVSDHDPIAFVWSPGGMSILYPPHDGHQSRAFGISDAGEVVGWYTTDPSNTIQLAYSWGGAGDLGTLGGDNSHAQAVNNLGQIVGDSDSGNGVHAFFFDGSQMIDIDPGIYYSSYATGINDAGQVVGNSGGRAFLWQDGNVTDLGPGSASAINQLGQVLLNMGNEAYLWQDGDVTDLGRGYASALNNLGQAVGGLSLYSDGTVTNVNDLLPDGSGWTLFSATGINDAGQIVGTGRNPTGRYDAFLLTPGDGSTPHGRPRTHPLAQLTVAPLHAAQAVDQTFSIVTRAQSSSLSPQQALTNLTESEGPARVSPGPLAYPVRDAALTTRGAGDGLDDLFALAL